MASREVILQPGCFLGVVASAIEAYNRETNGFLLGTLKPKRASAGQRPRAFLESAYPIQTEQRMPSWVSHGNLSAFDRARNTVRHLKVGLDLVGGFHSHTGAFGVASLSDLDLQYIQDEIHHFNRDGGEGRKSDRWLELVVAIRKKDYVAPKAPRWTWREYSKKIGCTVALGEHRGYDTTMAAYWVTTDPSSGNGHPPSIVGVEEAALRMPWSRKPLNS